jgi:hypothetical protein
MVKRRQPLGLPSMIAAVLGLLMGGPLLIMGRKAWWVPLVIVPIGIWLKVMCAQDPDWLTSVGGEIRLKRRYR